MKSSRCLQAEAQVEEQLFKLYHNERDIEGLAEELRVRQKDLERLVIIIMYTFTVCTRCSTDA